MDIEQLKYFVAVATNKSFSETAEIMFASQSTISKQIASLEKELNAKLFDRSKRKVALTEYGKIFLTHAQNILEDYKIMIHELNNLSQKDDNTVKIQATSAMVPYEILNILSGFKKENPWANIQMDEFDTSNVLNVIRCGDCDIAFFRVGLFDDDIYEKITFSKDRLICVINKSSPLSQHSILPINFLKNENFIFIRKNTCIHRYSLSVCTNAGFEPKIITTSNNISNILEMVYMNMGVAILPEKSVQYHMTDRYSENLAVIPLKDEFLIDVAAARCRKNQHNKACQALWDYLENLK